MKSLKPRKQRKEYFNAPLHKRRKWISSHLEENLLLKYDRRRISLVKDDTVKVMRGSYKGHEGKITRVNQRRIQVEVEGLVMTKADGKKIAKPIHASNLLITKLNLTDRWRRKKLERNLSTEVKKEIEKEAKEQLIETKKKIEEEKEKPVKKTDEISDNKKSSEFKNKVNKEEINKMDTEKEKETKIDKNVQNETANIKNQKKNINNIKPKPIKKEGGKNK